ncbi:MAG: pilus (MSHA type) biogenesis protein MshL [Magnetococcales bacterium]|nr:pilus (MSHA type) biogenesis protein MshL [Magnetococcales bacterium]
MKRPQTLTDLQARPAKRPGRTWLGLVLLGGSLLGAACSHKSDIDPSKGHLLRPTFPPPMAASPISLPPSAQDIQVEGPGDGGGEVYSVSVTNMPVRDLLFALASDAKLNIDIYPGIEGRVTLSAVDQTLPQILDRVARQVDLRYEIRDGNITVVPDRAYMKIYQVDYVNMERSTESSLNISTQLSTGAKGTDANPLAETEHNQSDTKLNNKSSNQFWDSLTRNLTLILSQGDNSGRGMPPAGMPGAMAGTGMPPVGGMAGMLGGAPGTGGMPGVPAGTDGNGSRSSIISINREAGVISIFGTADQHRQVQALLDSVLENVHRQVLIESTVVEVELSDRHQAGVDWVNLTAGTASVIKASGHLVQNTINMAEQSSQRPIAFGSLPFFSLPISKTWNNANGSTSTVQATVRALGQFGNVKVLSSPKIMALNNQTAILKVVENKIFFTLEAQASSVSNNSNNSTNNSPLYNTKIHTVPVGLVMSVTPQINGEDVVSMNVRPTISSISRWVNDPNPGLVEGNLITGVGATNPIPEIRVREMESMLRVHSGQVAVMGGLMQDKQDKASSGIPVLQNLPFLGKLFKYEDDQVTKTELVIFLRPIVMTHGKPKSRYLADRNMSAPIVHHTSPTMPPPAPPAQSTGLDLGSGSPMGGQGSGNYLDFTRPSSGGGGLQLAPPPAPLAPDPSALQSAPEDSAAAPPPAAAMAPPADAPPAAAPAAQGAATAPNPGPGDFYVDLGSYLEKSNADTIYDQIAGAGLPASRETAEVGGKTYQRVRSGPFPSAEEAEKARAIIVSQTGHDKARVTTH